VTRRLGERLHQVPARLGAPVAGDDEGRYPDIAESRAARAALARVVGADGEADPAAQDQELVSQPKLSETGLRPAAAPSGSAAVCAVIHRSTARTCAPASPWGSRRVGRALRGSAAPPQCARSPIRRSQRSSASPRSVLRGRHGRGRRGRGPSSVRSPARAPHRHHAHAASGMLGRLRVHRRGTERHRSPDGSAPGQGRAPWSARERPRRSFSSTLRSISSRNRSA
jgi:hypothetical protein